MENLNTGLIYLQLQDKLKNEVLNNDDFDEFNTTINEFVNTIKKSPLLLLEYKVLNNLENKHFDNDILAIKYIDDNIKLFEQFSYEEYVNEHKKLEHFIDRNIVESYLNNKKYNLYSAIDTLIKESLKYYDNVDVEKKNDAYKTIVDYLKNNVNNSFKENNIENDNIINETILNIAVKKFNKKYESLENDDKNLLKTIITSTPEKNKEVFESYKNEILTILNNLKENYNDDIIDNAIKKINEMSVDSESVRKNILEIYELKKGLENYL